MIRNIPYQLRQKILSKKSTVVPSWVFKSLSPFLYLNRIFFLLPLQWKKVNTDYVITVSTVYMIYSLVAIILSAMGTLYGQSLLFEFKNFQKRLSRTSTAITTYIHIFVILLISLISVIFGCFKANKYIDLIENLKKVDSHLMKSYGKNLFLQKIFIAYTIYVIGLSTYSWWKSMGPEHSFFLVALYYMPFYFCHYIFFIMDLLYWQVVIFVKIRLVTLNECLSKFFHSHKNEPLFPNKVSRRKVVDIMRQQYGGERERNVRQVQSVIKAYHMLFETNKTINDIFGLPILIIIIGSIFHLVATCHNFIDAAIRKKVSVLFALSRISWLIHHLFRFFLLVDPCQECLCEVHNTLIWTYKLLNSGCSKEVEMYLNILLVYISQCKIKFTVFGITKIRRGIFTTIAEAVTTYLLVLSQFIKK